MQHSRDYFTTYTGRRVHALCPSPADISISDIAHSLAMTCRYGGQCQRFYSVAEHSVLMWEKTSPENRLWTLLHDSPEAYINDIIRPVKRNIQGYAEIEKTYMDAIIEAFGLSPDIPDEVVRLDNRILIDERLQNMHPNARGSYTEGETEPLGVQLAYWSPRIAEAQFLRAFHSTISDTRSPFV